jgi:hypothetical protein
MDVAFLITTGALSTLRKSIHAGPLGEIDIFDRLASSQQVRVMRPNGAIEVGADNAA